MILVFDIGTTVLKGALIKENGNFIKFGSRKLKLKNGLEPSMYEADPVQWKSAFIDIVEELCINKSETEGIRALVISGNGPTLVPVDNKGEFIEPVMTWMDRRGISQSKKIEEYEGYYIDPTFYLPKALWLADNRREIYDKTKYFLSCPEAFSFWLTGEAVTILPGEKFEKYFWNRALLDRLDLDRSKFPDFTKPGNIIGRVLKRAAREIGLPEGLPVIAAGPDFIVSLLGTASVYPGRACDRCGTSEGINLCTELYITDPRLMGYGHVIEGYYNVSGIISTSGKALEWIREVLGKEKIGFDELTGIASGIKPGSDQLIFLPYLTGERAPLWDPSARGAFIGLGLNHGMEHLIRSVLESIGFAIRDVLDVMTENGGNVDELRITGGPGKSRLWNQIKADITGRRFLVPESSESELLGNLTLALRALGDSYNLAETADRIVRISEVWEPRVEYKDIYSELYGLYKNSYQGLKNIFHDLTV